MSRQKRRAQLLSRAATIALLSGLVAGCSADVSRFSEPFYTASTDNQRAIIGQSNGTADPTMTGSVGQQPSAPVRGAGAPSSGSHASVQQSSLPPLPDKPTVGRNASAGQWSSHSGQAADPDAAQALATRPAPRPGADPIETGSLPRGRDHDVPAETPAVAAGWSRTGGSVVTVGDGENGQTLSRRYGVPLSAILVANNLQDPGSIQPGQRVVIPTYVYSAANPAQSADSGLPQGRDAYKLLQQAPKPLRKPDHGAGSEVAVGGAAAGAEGDGTYIVRPGDSAASIAQKFAVTTKDLRAVNGLAPDDLLWIGQKLRIPSAGGRKVAALAGSANDAASTVTVVPAANPRRGAAPRQQMAEKPAADTATAKQEAAPQPAPQPQPTLVAARSDAASDPAPQQVAAAADDSERRIFAWPAKGPVISRFGRKPNGERNDGINISVPRGAPVHAAEKGVVIYSGNELKGYGNLVLVRHDDGWVSAYAHNASLAVQRGDAVRRGQVIASAGDSGSVSEPQVHFELRRNSKPVDPMPLMAKD